MQSYQSYIWLVVWLNLSLRDLTLEMAIDGERVDIPAMERAYSLALTRPTMGESTHGRRIAAISQKLPMVELSLTNFVLDPGFLQYFDAQRLQHLRLHRCGNSEIQLPEAMRGKVTLTVIH